MNRQISVAVLAALTGLFIYTSCTKVDTTDLGNELIPAVDNVHTFETILDVETNNFRYPDTTRVIYSDLHALGIIEDDPVFGRTEASLYSSFNPTIYGVHPFAVQDSVVIDSIVLSLGFSTLYGDSNALQKFEVFQIDPLTSNFRDSAYRLNEPDFAVVPMVLGSKVVDFKTLNDSLTYIDANDTIRTIKELRIRLDTSFGRQFVNFDTAHNYKSDSAFKIYFKGLAIKTSSASAMKNALAYFDLTNTANTKITFYTRLTNEGKIDTTTTVFKYTNRAQANLVRRTEAHDYLSYLNNGVTNDDKVFLQSSPGSYATVKIPGLDTFKTVNRVIHRAELIMETLPSTLNNIYTAPDLVFIDAINAAGDSTFTIRNDFVPASTSGTYDISSIGGNLKNNKYIFNLSRYFQSVVTKNQPDYTLRIYAPYYAWPYYQAANLQTVKLGDPFYVNLALGAGRAVVGGGNAATGKMKVRIIYSKI